MAKLSRSNFRSRFLLLPSHLSVVVALLLVVASSSLPLRVAYAETYLAVWEIQGSGHTSPYEGQRVNNVRGVVTADFQEGTGGPWELYGFFIQAHEPDLDSATSDGIFVYTGSSAKSVSVGDLVEIDRATVVEYQGPDSFTWELTLTELDCRSACYVGVLQAGYSLPPAEEYDPPQNDADALSYNEAREGMLVQVTVDATVIAAANQYNEFIVLRGTGQDRLHHDDPAHGHRIMVDGDGVAAVNCGQDGFGYIKTFDTINHDPANGYAVYGPLNYNFNMYKVQQDDDAYCIQHTAGDDSSYDPADNPAPAADANVLTTASFNAWNLFDTSDDPEKDDPVLTQEEYDHKSLKRAAAICDPQGLNLPLIVGLQEVENDTVLQKLVGDVYTLCGVTYDYYTLAGPDDRSIEVAFLARADRVTVLDFNDRQGCSATDWGVDYESSDHPPDISCDGDSPYYLHNRPPLHLEAQIDLAGSTRTIHVVNNHFKSKLTNSTCTISDCTDWRVEQAQHVDNLVDSLLASDPNALIVVVGDLNDYYNSDPLDILDQTYGVLTNVWDDMAGPPSSGQGTITRYSYIYNGVSQSLDHLLISDALNNLARAVSPRHLNADWPASHTDDTSMFRSSDHDPLLVGFDFSSGGDMPPSVSIINPADDSTVSGSVTIQVDATDAEDAAGTLAVEVSIDGGAWQATTYNSGSGYYELDWDTTAVADGSHTIDARATDSAANTGYASQVTVTVDNVNDPPTASFTYTCTDLTCDFDGSGSSDSDGSIVSYDWDFGDGNTGSGVTVSHTYAASGDYTVVLTVTDDDGATDSDSQVVSVGDGGFTLTATGYKVRGLQKADLEWSGATSINVDIYRDGALLTTTANDGFYTDNIDKRGGGSYTYQVCEEGTTACSNEAVVTF